MSEGKTFHPAWTEFLSACEQAAGEARQRRFQVTHSPLAPDAKCDAKDEATKP